MIVKNEAHQLRRCLTAVQPWVDEIILVDTGSEDDTVAIAREFTPHVYAVEWQQDFAAARNYSLQWATGEWIFYIDADEELIVTDSHWRSQLLDQGIDCFSVLRQEAGTHHNWSDFANVRFARRQPRLRFVGALHEQFNTSQGKVGTLKGIHLLHHNQQTQEQFLKKIRDRNIPILEQMVERGDRRLMNLVCLGDHYAACGRTEQSRDWYHQALDAIAEDIEQQRLPQETTWLRHLLFWATYTAFEAKDYDTAQYYASYGLRYFNAYPPLLYAAGLIVFELGLPRGALPYFHRCLDLFSSGTYDRSEPFDRQWMTTQPAYSLGFTYMTLQEQERAITYFQKTLEFNPHYQPAQQHLQHLLSAMAP
ncbi:glycosyltransferase [Synechococcus sp. PCC 6716]|nr:glycosyltransferase [Synechococcus sp. PCC 6716]